MAPPDPREKIKSIQTLYQPIVEIRSKKILGYEALTRGKGKPHFPKDLFRLSYEKGFTIDLDFRCLGMALRAAPRLRRKEFLFVNVEPITLSRAFKKGAQADLLLKKFSAPSRRQIVFELTEGMKARDFALVKKGVGLIKKSGCRFAIDDVTGIGAKLFRLLTLKPHYLKIDISLVRGIRKNRVQQGLLRRLVGLGEKNGCRLIAEGVEDKLDLALLREIGIHYAQGFYFSRPQKHLNRL